MMEIQRKQIPKKNYFMSKLYLANVTMGSCVVRLRMFVWVGVCVCVWRYAWVAEKNNRYTQFVFFFFSSVFCYFRLQANMVCSRPTEWTDDHDIDDSDYNWHSQTNRDETMFVYTRRFQTARLCVRVGKANECVFMGLLLLLSQKRPYTHLLGCRCEFDVWRAVARPRCLCFVCGYRFGVVCVCVCVCILFFFFVFFGVAGVVFCMAMLLLSFAISFMCIEWKISHVFSILYLYIYIFCFSFASEIYYEIVYTWN